MPVPAVTPVSPLAPVPAAPPSAPALPTLPPPVLSAPPAAPAHIPSDFTRILGGVSAASAPHAIPPAGAPAAGDPAAPRAKSSNLPLIIVLNVVVLAAIALVLYLVLKK